MYSFILFPFLYIPFLIYKFVSKKEEEGKPPLQFSYSFNSKTVSTTCLKPSKWSILHIYFNYSDTKMRVYEFLELVGPFVNEFTFDENACVLYVQIEHDEHVSIRELFQNPNFTYKCMPSSQSFIEYISDTTDNEEEEESLSDSSFCIEESKEYESIIENNKMEWIQQELECNEEAICNEEYQKKKT